MSHTQSRNQRSDSTQYRKTARPGGSNQQRYEKGNLPAKGGGGASSAIPNSSGTSSKKYAGNSQGVQPSVRSSNVDSAATAQALLNKGESDQLSATSTSVNAVQKDTPNTKVPTSGGSTVLPSNATTSAPISSATIVTSDTKAPAIPAKEDASRSFPLQFGSISPGIMDGFQIPARTSSAPPNLDEQKKSQTSSEASRAAPSIPNPSLSKQHLLKKSVANVGQNNPDEAQPTSKPKRDTQSTVAPLLNQSPKPSGRPIPSMPMQMPFHQQQIPLQFEGANSQIQPQALPGGSIPMPLPMHLPMGNAMMQQQIFLSGLQPHPVQPQGMMHQAQNYTLPTQMGHQMPTQLGSMGLNMGPHYSPQPPAKYGSSRKTVKITHPDTHKELKLDSAPVPRAHFNVAPQSQPVASFPPSHPMNFYPNSYYAPPVFLPTVSSVSLNAVQAPPVSQPARINNQVTVKLPEPVSATSTSLHGDESIRPKRENVSFLNSKSKTKPSYAAPLGASDSNSIESDLSNIVSTSTSIINSPSSTTATEKVVSVPAVSDSLHDKENKTAHRQEDQIMDADALKTEQISAAAVSFSETKEAPSAAITESLNSAGIVKDAENFDDVENFGNKGLQLQESKDARIILEKQKEAETQQNSKSDVNKLGTSLESEEISDKINEKSEEIASSFIDDTPNTKEEEDKQCVRSSESVDSKLGSAEMAGAFSAKDNCLVSSSDNTLPVVDVSVGDKVVENAEHASKLANDGGKNIDYSTPQLSDPQDKLASDTTNIVKNVVLRGKKKTKEFFRKAEAIGASSDLYMAYKRPDEKKESTSSSEGREKTSSNGTSQASAESSVANDFSNEMSPPSKVEPEDWEDAAEISPQLKSPENKHLNEGDGTVMLTKKYSRDFLLKFEGEWTDLPEEFEVTSDVADVLVVSSFKGLRDSYPSPGRHNDRPHSGSRLDYRGSGLEDEEKWNKFPGSHASGKGDLLGEIGYGNNVRSGRPGSSGIIRNQRPQMHLPYAGGIFSAPMQTPGAHGGLQRNYSDSEKWQRSSGFQRGLMPSPQTPRPIMHKAERRYEVGKITDEEEAKQRQLKAILNKLTPQNFEKLFQQVKEVNIDNVVTLSGVISQIFDKALMEPTFCEMYANFCHHLAADLPDLTVDDQKITFKRLLLNKCQEEFEKREREEEEAIKAEEEGESKVTPEEREEKRIRVRRRMLGNIRLIGELYKKRMLTERIMHECINKLLGQHQSPDEENIEALCKLMSTIGEIIDHQKAKVHMDAYFQNMAQLSTNPKLSSRVRFMLKDTIDLRKNKWQQRRKVEGPKKIEEVHRDAAQERHTQAGWTGRSSNMGNSSRRGSHMEFAPRAPGMLLSPPGSHIGGHHGIPQMRIGGSQDARMDEKHLYENRTISVPLPQRPPSDDSVTLGPQGGPRGMGSRGQPSAPILGLADTSGPGDIRRSGSGVNGFGPERSSYGQRPDSNPRYFPERHVPQSNHDQLRTRETAHSNVNRDFRMADHIFDRSPVSTLHRGGPPTSSSDASSEREFSEEHLRDKSLAAIKEFYSAKDKTEVALCIKELNSPGFYPTMICIWVSDSFEQKDGQRDSLTDLLISLTQSQNILNADQLIKGFESVLALLEDAVNDAPKATVFLGRMFARLIINNVIPYSEVARLVYDGGEDPGRLREIGLAAEVMGSILNVVESEKGDAFLRTIQSSSSIGLERFRPPGSNQRSGLDKFI